MRHAARIWLGILFLSGVVSTTAWAEVRTWKAAVGSFSTEAEFVELKAGNLVHLRLKDGSRRDIPLDKLSAADQEYVAKKAAPPATSSSGNSGRANRERLEKLEKDAGRCESAEEALRLYRLFHDDPATSDADRSAIESKIAELRSLAEKKMVRLKGQWVTAEVFKQNRDQANALMKQGLELLRLSQEDAFRKKFAEAAVLEPDSVRADFMIALIYGAIAHDYTKAKPYYDACLKRDPENAAVMNNLALTLVRKGDTPNAVMHWRKAAELLPDQRIVQNLGRFLDLAGQKKIAASKGSIETISNVYASLISSGKFERADLKKGWMYLLMDEDTMSLAEDDAEKKNVSNDSRPPAAEDGSVVVGGGTGWVVHPHYILTNNHVVDGGSSYDIQLSEGEVGRTMRATLIATQKSPDLALLRCDELEAPALTIDPTLLRRGTDIMTLGFPEMFKLGASLKATRGVISAVPASAINDMYLYDAVVNPGNSGGPVFDNHGNVVAVTTVLYMTAGRYGGGIPSSVALDFARKHIPDFNPAQPSKDVLEWPAIDQKVSPSTVLIWTRSKNGGSAKSVASDDDVIEDKYCMVCGGLCASKCPVKVCKDGVVTVNRQKAKCPACKGKGMIGCEDCKATGIELALIPERPASPPPSNNAPRRPPPQQNVPPQNRPQISPSRPPTNGSLRSDPSSKHNPLDADLAKYVATAIKDNKTQDTRQAGSGDTPFRTVYPDGSLVIGLDIAYFDRGMNDHYTGAFREIILTTKGKVAGPWHGDINNRTILHVEAKPGYAVGGLKVWSGLGIDGMIVVFMKINGKELDPTDSYESDFYGRSGGSLKELGMDGSLIVGIFGRIPRDPNSTFNGLGLITVPKR